MAGMRVPDIPSVSNVQVEAMRVPRASGGVPDVSGSARGIRRNLEQLADKIGAYFEEAARREDMLAAKRAYMAASAELNDLLYSPGDPNDPTKPVGFYARKGVNTSEMLDEASRSIQDLKTKYSGRLANDRQVRAFESFFDQTAQSSMSGLSRHRMAEMQKAEAEMNDSLMANSIADATADPYSPEVVNGALDRGLATLRSKAYAEGWTPERMTEEDRRYRTEFHSSVALRMLQDDPDKAIKYYDGVKDQLDPKLSRELRNQIEEKRLIVWTQTEADKLVAKYGADGEADALKAIEGKYSGDKEVRLKAEIEARYIDARRIKAEQTGRLGDALTNKIIDAGDLTSAYKIADQMPDGSERLALRKIAYDLWGPDSASGDGVNKVTPANLAARDALLRQIDEGAFNGPGGDLKFYQSLGDLTPSQRKEVADYRLKGGNVGGLSHSTLDSVVTELTGNKNALKKYPHLWDEVRKRLTPGREPTYDDLVRITAQLLTDGEQYRGAGMFTYNPDMNYYEALQKGVADSWLPDVDNEEEEQIKETLRGLKRDGKPVIINEVNIRKYKKHVILGIPYNAPKQPTPAKPGGK